MRKWVVNNTKVKQALWKVHIHYTGLKESTFFWSRIFQSPISTFDILGDDCLEIRHLVEIL